MLESVVFQRRGEGERGRERRRNRERGVRKHVTAWK